MTKKLILLLFLLVTIWTIIPFYAFGANDFAGHWAENSIKEFLSEGYVKGYPDGTFKPEKFMTRAEFVKLVNSTFNCEEITNISFKDVNSDEWYFIEIQKAYKAGYISGVSSSEFAPNNNITREQAAVILSKIIKLKPSALIGDEFVDNHNISEWAKIYVSSAYAEQLLNGYEDRTLKPQNHIKRAEAVEMIKRALEKLKSSNSNDNTIKILTIGNSFSQDIDYYVYDIAKSAGIEVIVGNLYNSGCSLERHLKYALNNEKAYTYYKWESDKMTKLENQTMKNVIFDERWDYITFQQSSGESGIYSTYQPYLNKLISYVKGIALNHDVKYALNMTWAYSGKSKNDDFFFYHYSQDTMYNAIVNSYKYAAEDAGINLIIPFGTAIQNARTNKYLYAIGNELTSDGYHLNMGIGRYIAGLTMFNTIIKEEGLETNLVEDVKFIPDLEGDVEKLADLAKKAAINASLYPYNVKTIN